MSKYKIGDRVEFIKSRSFRTPHHTVLKGIIIDFRTNNRTGVMWYNIEVKNEKPIFIRNDKQLNYDKQYYRDIRLNKLLN